MGCSLDLVLGLCLGLESGFGLEECWEQGEATELVPGSDNGSAPLVFDVAEGEYFSPCCAFWFC